MSCDPATSGAAMARALHRGRNEGTALWMLDTLMHVLLALAVVIVTARLVGALFSKLKQPPVVGEVIGPVARSVVEQRSGVFLWIGGFFGLWTVGSLVETIRDVLRRAYGTKPTRGFWFYRLLSTGMVIVSVILLMLSLIAQVLIGAAQAASFGWPSSRPSR